MDPMLPLHPLHSVLPLDEPFTPAMARAVGISRVVLDRLLREGLVRRMLRGVYLPSVACESIGVRAAAVGLAIGASHGVVVDRTAAWVHGALAQDDLAPIELLRPPRSARSSLGGRRGLVARDLEVIGPVRLTTPLRTALDVGRLLPAGDALAVMDVLFAGGSFTHAALLAELSRFNGHTGVAQLRSLAAQVDPRPVCPAESLLRLHWNAARLPTPVPGMPVAAGSRLVRLSLGVGLRQFGAVLAHQVSAADLLALEGAGWRVVVLPQERLLSTDPAIWTRHLEREFHQHLLGQVKDEEEVG
ncbi:MAG: type IV toxin-antitoxin system AbiEi family antitoxin domain-containing protein [Marmoricola sp.]